MIRDLDRGATDFMLRVALLGTGWHCRLGLGFGPRTVHSFEMFGCGVAMRAVIRLVDPEPRR
jgi:hypothetical protein